MLVAWGLVASLLSTKGAAPLAEASPPIVVDVTAPPDLSPALVSELLEEAAALWRPAGVRFIWQYGDRRVTSNLLVVVGGGAGRANDEELPLGWISFDADQAPQPWIFVSARNANILLANSSNAVGRVEAMPKIQLEAYLARAMGRALAHELGHFLLASKLHAEEGLMKGRHTSYELFGLSRRGFTIDRALRDQLVLRHAGHRYSQRSVASP